MSDATLARLHDVRTVLGRAARESEGECQKRICMAMACVSDAIEEREDNLERLGRLRRDFEVLADCLTTPDIGAGE